MQRTRLAQTHISDRDPQHERLSRDQLGFASGGSRHETVQTHRGLNQSVGWSCVAALQELAYQSRLVRDLERGSGGGPVPHDAHW